MGKIIEYNKQLTKRLLIIIPLAITILVFLLITVEHTKIVDHIFSVGYEGPMQLIPEITIIDDEGLKAEFFSKERHEMIVKNVVISGEKEENVDEEAPDISTSPEKEPEETILDDIPGMEYMATYPTHADVPYREDYVILNMFQPEYPEDAIEKRSEGYVLVEVYVNESGYVDEVYVRKVFGMESFKKSSLDAVRQFTFKPVMEDGKPRSFWISFLISFRLND